MAETVITQGCSAVVIGGSAGSLDVLLEIFPKLDKNLPFPIIIVIHRKPGGESLLTDLLQNRTQLNVMEAEEKQPIKAGYVYIAPADYHLLIEENQSFSLDYSEKINYSRPSIDVTFQSAADVYKDSLYCILLSGSNADGLDGMRTVKRFKGKLVIQNPDTAIMPFMPQQVKSNLKADYILNAWEMASFINNLCKV
ncbi:chemotaxis protein CheB [Pedobacter changchengzhani]|uniref:protein-glutamate methylesterase n=1 Tax=Pedobacter changchengzhani TaxID=2529274 RepID=A0A4R5MNR3_9SPHI|nr:chemotaxis protein CheB [Pedobacter changchengzhani]TDG37470.1 chemotaxis protein CheB [Pedobacter changchengzhani]